MEEFISLSLMLIISPYTMNSNIYNMIRSLSNFINEIGNNLIKIIEIKKDSLPK